MIRLIVQFLTLVMIYLTGELIVHWFKLPIPGSILGTALLLIGLLLGFIKLSWVELIAQLHLKHISLLFIPFAVGILQYIGRVQMDAVKLTIILVISSLGILFVTAYIAEFFEARGKRRGKNDC